MRSILFLLALVLLAYGLWAHDWTTIIASLLVAIIWPIIENDVRQRQHDDIWDTPTDPRHMLGTGWTQHDDGVWYRNDGDPSDSA